MRLSHQKTAPANDSGEEGGGSPAWGLFSGILYKLSKLGHSDSRGVNMLEVYPAAATHTKVKK